MVAEAAPLRSGACSLASLQKASVGSGGLRSTDGTGARNRRPSDSIHAGKPVAVAKMTSGATMEIAENVHGQ